MQDNGIFFTVFRYTYGAQFLADQFTLSQPGGHIIPTQYYTPWYYKPPQIFRPCDGPGMAIVRQSLVAVVNY